MDVGHKILKSLKEALRFARGESVGRATVFRGGWPVQRFTDCRGCGGMTLTIKGRCESCGDPKIAETA